MAQSLGDAPVTPVSAAAVSLAVGGLAWLLSGDLWIALGTVVGAGLSIAWLAWLRRRMP